MTEGSRAAGLAALSVGELILLSLTDNNIIDEAGAKAILEDAAAAHREAAPLADGSGGDHAEAAALLEAMIQHGNACDGYGQTLRPVATEPNRKRPDAGNAASIPGFRATPIAHRSNRTTCRTPVQHPPPATNTKRTPHGADRQDRGRESLHHQHHAKPATDNVAELRQRAVTKLPRSRVARPSGLRMQRVTVPRPSSGRPVRQVRRSAS